MNYDFLQLLDFVLNAKRCSLNPLLFAKKIFHEFFEGWKFLNGFEVFVVSEGEFICEAFFQGFFHGFQSAGGVAQ